MSKHYLSYSYSIAAGLALALCGSANAQQEDAVVVTASRVEQQIKEAIPNTTVITEREIKSSGVTDLPSLLRGRAGVELTQNGGLGGSSALFLRGGNSAHALVLVDGVRVESATTGTTAIEHIMLDEVERVEIVRGNVSALYGSGAMGGVVQIFTKSGTGKPGTTFEGMAGSRGTHRLGASYGGRTDDTRVALSVSQTGTRGFSTIDPQIAPLANPDRDGYRNTSVTGLIAQRVAPDHEFGVRFYRAQGKTDFDSAWAPDTPADVHWSESAVQSASIFLDSRMTESWRSRLTFADGGDHSDSFKNGQLQYRFDTRNRQAAWQNDVALAKDHTLTARAERLTQEVDSTTAYARTRRDVDSLTLGYTGRLGAHQLQAAARRDDYSDFGVASTGLLGYGYALTDAWKLTAMTSTAFRAPTFNELFYPPDPVFGGGGNPNLRPERSRSSELGVQYADGTHLARAVLFRTRYRDLIDFNPVNALPANVSHAHVSGAELTWTGQFADWRARASLTRQNPIDDDAGVMLRRRARTHGGGEISREFGPWRLSGEIVSSGARRDYDLVAYDPVTFAPVPVTLERYALFNLGLRYRIDRSIELWARVENATDKHYQLAHGYNPAPRGIFLGVRWQPAQ